MDSQTGYRIAPTRATRYTNLPYMVIVIISNKDHKLLIFLNPHVILSSTMFPGQNIQDAYNIFGWECWKNNMGPPQEQMRGR
jgi:hypothetical protein